MEPAPIAEWFRVALALNLAIDGAVEVNKEFSSFRIVDQKEQGVRSLVLDFDESLETAVCSLLSIKYIRVLSQKEK